MKLFHCLAEQFSGSNKLQFLTKNVKPLPIFNPSILGLIH